MDVLYIMNVDWNWIKQRPHFIAELLNERMNVHVIYQHRYGRTGFQKRAGTKVDTKPIYVIPRGDRYNSLSKINQKIKKYYIRKYIKCTKAEVLYLTFPDQVETLPDSYKGIVVYDCMDNHPAFVKDDKKKERMISQEKDLIDKSDLILVSSEHLKNVLKMRYGSDIEWKINLVRNGYNGEIVDKANTVSTAKEKYYTFTYFGTISSWFDFDKLLRSLEEFPNIQYELFGPIAGTQIPKHERLHYHGTVEHEDLLQNVKIADCLIMPFIVNEIIESVDPVKLYEYINFNKNILVSQYKEIERFDPFVYFYNDYEEYEMQIKKLMHTKENKYNDSDRKEFLMNNSWKCRVDQIVTLLSKIEKTKV